MKVRLISLLLFVNMLNLGAVKKQNKMRVFKKELKNKCTTMLIFLILF